jgi:hypothetical protein
MVVKRLSLESAGMLGGAALVMGCAAATIPPDWRRVDAGEVFSFYAPAATQRVPGIIGIDSFAGRYVAPDMRIGFDFGAWTGSPCDRPDDPITRGNSIIVSGLRGTLCTYGRPREWGPDSLPYIAGLFVSMPPTSSPMGPNALGITVPSRTKRAQTDAVRLLRSVEIHVKH